MFTVNVYPHDGSATTTISINAESQDAANRKAALLGYWTVVDTGPENEAERAEALAYGLDRTQSR